MRILVTGSSGFIGSALIPHLVATGHGVTRLVRSAPRPGGEEVFWNPEAGKIDSASLEGFDAVVHLAGENIAAGRWTARRKARIRDSRITGTRLLAQTLAGLVKRSRALICSSAIGYYGNRGDEILKESSPPGADFLAGVCCEWEAAAGPAAGAGIRVVNLRTGIVLGREGGVLGKMLLPFQLGLGGKIGGGKQYMSWIAMDDLAGVFLHALRTDSLAGPVNAVAPQPVTNAEFTKTLGRILHRPTLFPMPAFAARLALGEMADALLLSSARVEPARLVETGFQFRFRALEPAVRHVLGRP